MFEKKISSLDQLIHLGLLILAIGVPFHAFLKTWLTSLITASTIDYLAPGSFVIGSWKEILIVLMVMLVLIKWITTKKFPFEIQKVDGVMIGFLALVGVYVLFSEGSWAQRIFGVKTDTEFLVLYLVARSVPWKDLEMKRMLKCVFTSASVVVILGLMLVYLLPQDFLLNFGYAPYVSSYVDYKPLPIFHGLGEQLETYRLASTLSGANQLGGYLVVMISLGMSLLISSITKKIREPNVWFLGGFVLIAMTTLYHTFSRSAWIGLLVSVFVLILVALPDWKKRVYLLVTLCGAVLLGLWTFYLVTPEGFWKYTLHGSSTELHLERMQEGAALVLEHPLGLGIGQAGPVQRRFEGEEGMIISENWYLQIGEELGILGALLFLALITMTAIKLFQIYQAKKEPWPKSVALGIFLALIGFSTTGLFLHSFEDSTTSLTLFLLIGMLIAYSSQPKTITEKLLSPALKFFMRKP